MVQACYISLGMSSRAGVAGQAESKTQHLDAGFDSGFDGLNLNAFNLCSHDCRCGLQEPPEPKGAGRIS